MIGKMNIAKRRQRFAFRLRLRSRHGRERIVEQMQSAKLLLVEYVITYDVQLIFFIFPYDAAVFHYDEPVAKFRKIVEPVLDNEYCVAV